MDPRFFQKRQHLTHSAFLALLYEAGLLNAKIALPTLPARFEDMKPLHEAGPHDISFFHNARYINDLTQTAAGVVLIPDGYDLPVQSDTGAVFLPVSDVHQALAIVGAAFVLPPSQPIGIHPLAQVAETAKIDPSAYVGPFVHIEDQAEIGAETFIDSHVKIGRGVVIGRACRIEAQVTISHALIGDSVHIKPGASIGQRGFGWALSPTGHVPKPQVGRVLVRSGVEIGANTVIDRGSVEDTVIGEGTVIDNLCHIAHNCKIGKFCALAGATAFAGSTTLGDFVQIGGAVISKGHVHVGDKAIVRIKSFIGTNIAPGADVAGNPARPIQSYHRLLRHWSRISRGAKGA